MWWHPSLTILADQLSKGVLNEMKNRILTSNIQKEKLQLNEDTDRMKDFFTREIQRFNNRKDNIKVKQQTTEHHIQAYRNIIRNLLKYNQSLANKCETNNIDTNPSLFGAMFTVHDSLHQLKYQIHNP